MKILLISCHETLERIESKIFRELGHEVTIIGFNMASNSGPFNQLFLQHNAGYIKPCLDPSSGFCRLMPEMVEDFDLVVSHHYPHNLQENWQVLQKKNVIIRSIGMPNTWLDDLYDQFKSVCPKTRIVRMSEFESPRDALITQCYESAEPWVGNVPKILTVRKMFKKRAHEQCFDLYEEVMTPLIEKGMVTLAGSENEDIPYCINPTTEELVKLHSSHQVYFYPPNRSSFVTFSLIEAMAAGIPIVTASEKLTGVPVKYIKHGENGVVCDDVGELRTTLYFLIYGSRLRTTKVRKEYSDNLKEVAKQFSYERIKEQWRLFLKYYS